MGCKVRTALPFPSLHVERERRSCLTGHTESPLLRIQSQGFGRKIQKFYFEDQKNLKGMGIGKI